MRYAAHEEGRDVKFLRRLASLQGSGGRHGGGEHRDGDGRLHLAADIKDYDEGMLSGELWASKGVCLVMVSMTCSCSTHH